VSVGGDHGFTKACSTAARAAPRVAPPRAAERLPEGSPSRLQDSAGDRHNIITPPTKDAQGESVVVRGSREIRDAAVVNDSPAVQEPLVTSDARVVSEPAVVLDARADRESPAVPRARNGGWASGPDDGGFGEYVSARSRALLRTAYLLTGNVADAEDLVQAALAKTFLAWDRIEDRSAVDGYVRRAMVNTHISWWRRRRVEEYPTDEIPDQAVADHAVSSDLQETLKRAIDRLPQRMRAAVVLRYYEDMTEAEVAEVLGVSLGTVKSTVSRAVAKLRTDADLQSE
jgi:RNA polymerase sigma-70 factor (sigma-E family)